MPLWTNTDNEDGKPKYLSSADKAKTYGMDTAEIVAGGDDVTSVALVSVGARYTESQSVVFSGGGGGSGAAAGTAGGSANNSALTGISVTNTGSGYISAPTVVVPLPRRTIRAEWVNLMANVITYPSHRLNAGDQLKYFHGGGTPITGLTNNTIYYVISSGLLTNAFKVSALDGGSEVVMSGTGNDAQYFELQNETNRATAVATLGYGSSGMKVTSVVLSFAGTGYTEATHTATVTGGGGSSATITYTSSATAPGTITSVDVTNVGGGYTSVPTITFGLPRRTINTTFMNTTTNVISYPNHFLTAGTVLKYFDGGGTAATGLTNNTTYYVIDDVDLTSSTFKVSETLNGTEVAITGTGNVDQYFELQDEAKRATAVATLGHGSSGMKATHAGWVLRTVGTGGRAGRVTTETLVAMGSMKSDASDDTVLPDA